MKKRILSTILALMIAMPAFASLAVSPTKIDINATKIKTNYTTTAIEVRGDSKTPMRFRVSTGYFKVNEKGELVFFDKSDDPNDMSKRLKYIPSEFTVAQGKTQKLRLNIPNLNTLPDGESRAMVYIEDVNVKEMNYDTGMDGVGAQLIIKTRVGIPVYIEHGNAVRVADFDYAKITKQKDGYYLEAKIKDTGNSKVRCKGAVQISQGKKLISETKIDDFVVAPGNYNIIRTKINTNKIESGNYTARVVVTYKDINEKVKNIKQDIELNI